MILRVGESFKGCYEKERTINGIIFKLTFSALLLGNLTRSFQIVEGEDVLEFRVCEHDGAGTVGLAGFNLLNQELLELILAVELLVADESGQILKSGG